MPISDDAVVGTPNAGKLVGKGKGQVDSPNDVDAVSKGQVDSPNDVDAVSKGQVDSPNDVDAVSKGQVDSPNVITANSYSDDPPFPLSHARILYENKLIGASISGSSSTIAARTLIPNTFERWSASRSNDDAFINYTMSSVKTIDSVGVAAHNLGSVADSIELQISDDGGSTTTTISDYTLIDNRAILFLFEPVDIDYVRLVIKNIDGTAEIGVVYAGESLQMQRPIYGGHTPGVLNSQTDYQNSISNKGQFLGRTITRQGANGSFEYQRLKTDWVRQYFMPFVEAAKKNPFFISWRPDDHPDEVLFGWTTNDISPSNSGGTRRMSVSFDIQAYQP